ncbi:MAG: hypothetical protein PHE55_01290 [Methylococcaceae bacterium]|nr:hypothetical protein [Methylococcaceae bacterium]
MDPASPKRLSEEAGPIRFNPADYFTFVLDQEIRDAGMPGGYCGFVLELGGEPDLESLQRRLDLLLERFPRASARLEKRGKRYFWIPTGRRILLERHRCSDGDSLRIILEIFNRKPSSVEPMPLSLHWIAGEVGGLLLLNWIHPLLDARGGKILLDFLGSNQPEAFRESPSLIEEKLSQWSLWKKIRFFFKAKSHNEQANSLDSSLPTAAEQGKQSLRFKVRRYDAAETQRISRLAQQTTGLAGKTLYYIGCFMRAMEQAQVPVAKEGYCVPYAFNLRRQNAPTPVFGNHVSCLFARATRSQVGDRDGLFAHLLAQYRQTVQEELDFAYLPLMWLGQWLSPARYAKLLRKQKSGGELSSAWFSDIGDLRWGKEGFLGVPVDGLFTLCWMTLPPGLALLIGQSNGQLTLSYSYLHPAVDESWLERVMKRMDAELLETVA